MKRGIGKKLALNRETLQSLQPDDLARVNGGADGLTGPVVDISRRYCPAISKRICPPSVITCTR